MPTPLLAFDRLSLRFDDRVLFTALSFATGAGCVALEADTGTGKSTLLRMLAGETDAGEGHVTVAGHSLTQAPDQARAALAYIPEDLPAYPVQTGRAFLEQVAAARHTSLDDDVLTLADAFGLTPHLDKRFEQMSFGTRKKVLFSATMIGHVPVIIADEPTSGLDGPSRRALAELFQTLAADRVVFFTSYDADFVRATDARVVRFADLQSD